MRRELLLLPLSLAFFVAGWVLLSVAFFFLGGWILLLVYGNSLSFVSMKNVIVLDDDEDPAPRPEVIVLDDGSINDDFARASRSQPRPPQPVVNGGTTTPTRLTEEQRKRIAQQKELAAQRRRTALEKRSSSISSSSSSSSAQFGIPPASQSSQALSPSYARHSYEAAKSNSDWMASAGGPLLGSTWIPGSDLPEDDDSDVEEWALSKRPAMGHSFDSRPKGSIVKSKYGFGGLHPEDSAIALSPARAAISRFGSEEWDGEGGSKGEDEKAPSPPLSERQESVLKAVRAGSNVFLTGSAGTGKSFVLEHVIKVLRQVHGSGVHVTASTGLAACALGGTTLHSFAGVGLGTDSPNYLAQKVMGKKDAYKRWRDAKALVIDEISMIDGTLFDKVDYVGRFLRESNKPFGGLQLVVSGDFFQLPPVKPEDPAKYFAFQADCWSKAFDMQIELDIVFRQADQDFVDMLNEIRRGRCSPELNRTLQSCHGPASDDSGVVLTRLYPLRVDVGRENDTNLRGLGKPIVVFTALDRARSDFFKNQLAHVGAAPILNLCIGAQVMLAKNLDPMMGLVNGARGVVVDFTSADDHRFDDLRKSFGPISPSNAWPVVRFAESGVQRAMTPEDWRIMEGEVEIACRTQVPLILAWALSVHKCQGMTLDRVDTDLRRAFDFGMIYVALSRVKSLKGLRLRGFDPGRIKVHPRVSEFYRTLADVTYSSQNGW